MRFHGYGMPCHPTQRVGHACIYSERQEGISNAEEEPILPSFSIEPSSSLKAEVRRAPVLPFRRPAARSACIGVEQSGVESLTVTSRRLPNAIPIQCASRGF